MNICLINPPSTYRLAEYEEWNNNSLSNSSYLGIWYLEAALKAKNMDVDVYDCPYEQINMSQLNKILFEKKYDYIGISSFYYNLLNVERIIKFCELKISNTFVFLGGYAVTLDTEEILRKHPFVKCVFVAEGEQSITEFFEHIKEGSEWRKTEGIAYIDADEFIISPRLKISDIDDYAFPVHMTSERSTTVSVLSSRGCYGNCSFCSEKQFYISNGTKQPRYRSVKSVIDELEIIRKNTKIKYISFADSNFMPGSQNRRKWLLDFCEQLEKKNINFHYRLNTRANDVISNRELIPILKEAGFDDYFIGIESFSQSQLDFYNKNTKVQQNIDALKILKDCNVRIEIGFLPFEPYVTLKELQESIEVLSESDIFHNINYTQEFFSVSSKLFLTKGTRIYDCVKQEGLLFNNDIGYRFVYDDVDKYYRLIEQWATVMYDCRKFRFLIDKSLFFQLGDCEKKLRLLYSELLYKDILVMKQLLHVTLEQAETILRQSVKEIMQIIKNYYEVINYIEKYEGGQ